VCALATTERARTVICELAPSLDLWPRSLASDPDVWGLLRLTPLWLPVGAAVIAAAGSIASTIEDRAARGVVRYLSGFVAAAVFACSLLVWNVPHQVVAVMLLSWIGGGLGLASVVEGIASDCEGLVAHVLRWLEPLVFSATVAVVLSFPDSPPYDRMRAEALVLSYLVFTSYRLSERWTRRLGSRLATRATARAAARRSR
jgi:hypothetical protein